VLAQQNRHVTPDSSRRRRQTVHPRISVAANTLRKTQWVSSESHRITQNHTDTANVRLGHGHLAKQRTTAHSPTHADEIERYTDCRAIRRRLTCGEGRCIRAEHKNTNETRRIHTRQARYIYNSMRAQTQARTIRTAILSNTKLPHTHKKQLLEQSIRGWY